MSELIQSLKSKRFFLYFLIQTTSILGSWMQYMALGWITYRTTGSPTALGIVGLVGGLPLLLLSPLVGPIIDQSNKRLLLVATQSLLFMQAFLLGILSLNNQLSYVFILFLSLTQGIVYAVDQPLRQAILPSLIDNKGLLQNAIALTSISNNVARVLGPTLSGIIILHYSESVCFFFDAGTFFTMAVFIFSIKIRLTPKSTSSFSTLWKQGFYYIKGNKIIFESLCLAFIISATVGSYTMLMPVISNTVYGGNPAIQGYLIAASGIGAIIAGLYTAKYPKTPQSLIKAIPVASIISSSALIAFCYTTSALLGAFALFIVGGAMVIATLSLNTLIQLITVDEKRGYVMSFFTMAYLGTSPISKVCSGFLAERFGVLQMLITAALICIGFSVLYSRRSAIQKK
ncbi:MAG: MFS transporter [Pseudomonadota bacterium]